MRHLAFLCSLSLVGCFGPCARETTPPPVDPGTLPMDPVPDAPAIYTFEITNHDGTPSGNRVLSDGRVQVRTSKGWAEDHPLTRNALKSVIAALETEAMAKLPDELPVVGVPQDNPPRASWTFVAKGKTRTIVSPVYTGIRVPALEVIHRALAKERKRPMITTRWTINLGEPQVVDLPCSPLETRQLRQLTASLLDREYPESKLQTPGDVWVRIDWHDQSTTWSTVLYDDGRVSRIRPDGSVITVDLPQKHVDGIQESMAAVPWTDTDKICKNRI